VILQFARSVDFDPEVIIAFGVVGALHHRQGDVALGGW